jgi:putative ABC transport system ATP-binding protein
MINIQNVSKVFNAGRPNEFTALSSISLNIQLQEVTILKGPSGSGKTTLLSLIGCMARPTSGRIFVNYREITSLPERFLTGIRRETFGFIFQRFNLLRGFSALENVMAPAYPTGEKYSLLKKRALDLLAMLDLDHKHGAKSEWLSGGEAQRVAIARALIHDPAIIIADEPTAHLDAKLSAEFLSIMEILKKEGKTLIIASHDPLIYDSSLAGRIVEIHDGELALGGTTA